MEVAMMIFDKSKVEWGMRKAPDEDIAGGMSISCTRITNNIITAKYPVDEEHGVYITVRQNNALSSRKMDVIKTRDWLFKKLKRKVETGYLRALLETIKVIVKDEYKDYEKSIKRSKGIVEWDGTMELEGIRQMVYGALNGLNTTTGGNMIHNPKHKYEEMLERYPLLMSKALFTMYIKGVRYQCFYEKRYWWYDRYTGIMKRRGVAKNRKSFKNQR